MKTSRRTFIKGMCAAYALGALPPGAIAAQKNPPVIKGKKEFTNTTCEMCSFRCPVRVQVTDEKIFIQGNNNAPQQQTRICGRGGSGFSLVKDPKRIVQPMKRSGPRGAGKWDVITWETAYKEIAEKMQTIAGQNGPESIVFSAKSGSLTNHFFQFARTFGSPNTFTHISTCPGGRYVTADIIMGFNLGADVENTDYLIHFGHNLYEGIEVADTFSFMEMQAKGGKVVSFDPRLSIASSKADEYFFIKPGSDTAVILAMCNVLIQENLYDEAFVKRFVEGFNEYAEAIKGYTPEFAAEHSGVAADDIRRIAREFAAAPSAIASPGHRTTFSYEEFDMRRGLFVLNILTGNLEKKGGLYLGKGAEIYNSIAGKTVAPEISGVPVTTAPRPAAKRIDAVNPMYAYMIPNGGVYQSIFETALSGEPYPVKGWFLLRSNPFQTVAELPKMIEAANTMELIVSCDVYMTDTASYADYFLPDCTYLERGEDITESTGLFPTFTIRRPAIEVLGNAKPSWMIWKELAGYLGLEEYYWWNTMADRHFAQVGEDEDLYNEIVEKGFLSYGIPLLFQDKDSVDAFVKKYPASEEYLSGDGTFSGLIEFGTDSGKIELCPEVLDEIAPGYRLPRFQNIPLKENENELFFIQGKVALHTNSGTAFVPNLSYYMPDNPVWMHPDTAGKIGVKTGDSINLENAVGKERGKVFVTTGIRADTVFTYMAGSGVKTGNRTTKAAQNGVNCANLLKLTISDVTAMAVHTSGVRISKA